MCEIPKIPKIHDYNRDKTRSFGIKTQGNDFRYAVNFAIIAKIQGIAKIQIFAMHSNFRYDSEFLL